ncbi:MAG: hypothetical protein Kapaf2KO_04500 [Candidatus Kapaibacteriales bacterium]
MANKLSIIAILFAVLIPSALQAQRVGFINSDLIRDKFPEAQQADQRLESIVNEWKRELAIQQQRMDDLDFEIQKNRLIWTEYELAEKKKELQAMEQEKQTFAAQKFEPGGEYEKTVESIFKPVEEKIFATVQKVAAEEDFDIILDQSIQPIPYVNFRYDLTLNVLREMGVDVKQLEAEQDQKIANDPRNQEAERKRTRRRVTRNRDTEEDPENKEEVEEKLTEEERAKQESIDKRRRRR